MFLFGDTFDSYATAQLSRRYQRVGPPSLPGNGVAISAGTGRGGSQSMRCTNINGCIGRGLTLSTATHFVHFAIRPTALTTHGVIAFWNSVYQRQHVVISLNDNGSLSVRKETSTTQIDAAGINISSTTVLGTTPAGLVTPNAWVHIGCAVKVHATTGTATLYVNGAAVLTLTGQ